MSGEEQLERWRWRYRQRGLAGKGRMLDEPCQEYGYQRKHAIRLLNGHAQVKGLPPGRESRYEPIVEVLERTWAAGEQACGKRLPEMLPLSLPHYQRRSGRLLPSRRGLAGLVSAATLDRLLAPLRAPVPVGVTRSRPYHKDDNAHAEQNNWTWPRQLLGYRPVEDPELAKPINRVYADIWGPLQNYFLPSMKLVKKWREAARWRRRRDRPQTADQRLLGLGVLPGKAHRQRPHFFEGLDPFALHAGLDERLRPILAKALEVPGKRDFNEPLGGRTIALA
jgi:hypothetical protein